MAELFSLEGKHFLQRKDRMNEKKNTNLKRKRSIWEAGRKNDGYMTIEMILIFPVIFFSLLLMLFMGIVLYQEVNLQSLAVRASERGAVTYSSRVSDLTTNIKTLEDFKKRDPYRNLPLMDQGKKAEYIALINTYVDTHMGKQNLLLTKEGKNAGNYAQIQDYLIVKRVKVNVQTDYHTPVDAIAEMFGQEGVFHVNTTAVSAVVDAPEFVRNADIVTDVIKQTKVFGTVENGYNKLREAVEWLEKAFKK